MLSVSKRRRIKHPPHLKVKGFSLPTPSVKEVADILNIAPTAKPKLNGYLHFTFDEVEKF